MMSRQFVLLRLAWATDEFRRRSAEIDRSEAAPTAKVAVLPHPSGLSRLWNELGSFGRARETVRALERAAYPLVTVEP